MVKETLASVLFLDEDGFPVSQREQVFSLNSGVFSLSAELPRQARSARIELPALGDVLVRVLSASVNRADAQLVQQNAVGVQDGDLFVSCPPRYLVWWDERDTGPFSFSAAVTPLDARRALEALTSSLEGWKQTCFQKDAEISRIERALNDIHTSHAWRAVRVYYKAKDGLRAALSWPGRTFRAGARLAYRILPLSAGAKLRFKRFILSNFNFLAPLSGSIRHSRARLKAAMDGFCHGHRETLPLPPPPDGSPGTVAVHLHLHYIDLLDEFFTRISEMPFPFDLYVSVTDPSARETVSQALADCPNVRSLCVEAVPNRGRDVAPMLVTFGGLLAGYDYILHIHSKKSPHLKDAFDWRKYLLDILMGGGARIAQILSLFERHPEVGIVYPEPFSEIPYWTLTTLSNETELRRLLRLAGLDYPEQDKYVDFPVGTMFWARGAALSRLLNAGITLEDFPEEAGQLDGTLSHAAERSLCLAARQAGFRPAQLSANGTDVSIGLGERNLSGYLATDAVDMARYISRFKHASFDVFGTLVCSRYESDYALWSAVERSLGRPFARLRAAAEHEALSRTGSADIHNIYLEFKSLSGLSSEECEQIKALEFSLLLESCLPRQTVVSLYNRMISQRFDAVIAADTVWPKAYIDRILDSCGVSAPKDMYLSCQNGLYKQGGRIYDFLAGRFRGQIFVHVGDHELDDVQTPNDHRFPSFHVMHPRDMMQIGLLDETYFERCCHDPFCLTDIFRELKHGTLTEPPAESAVPIA